MIEKVSMLELLEKYFVEIIGITGTLLGVLLGAFLNRLSRIGRVKIYINNVKYSFSERDDFGGYKSVETISPKTERLNINVELDVINTSEYSKKIMRDISFVISNTNFKKMNTVDDNSTRRSSSGMIKINELKFINLQPKELINLNLSTQFNEDFEKILGSKWFLEYKKLNNRKEKIRIIKN